MNKEDGPAVGPWLLGLFIFVVCGSGKYDSRVSIYFFRLWGIAICPQTL